MSCARTLPIGRLVIPAFTLLMITLGCAVPGRTAGVRTDGPPPNFSKEQLRNALEDFADYVEATIKQAALDIDERQPDRQTRIATLMWRSRALPAFSSALKEADAIQAYLDCWTVCVRFRIYFEQGDGKALFGEQQPIAINASRQIEAGIERIGRLFMTEDRIAQGHQEVQAFAAKNPITGTFANAYVHTTTTTHDASPILGAILKLPLAPFQMFEGIDKGAAAIYGFTTVAGRFADIVEEWPESLSWQLQLMLLQLEQYETVRTALAAFTKLADSSADMAQTARHLPAEFRKQASELMAELDAKQVNLQATLKQAEQTAATVERALQKAGETSDALDRTARSVAEAGIAWNETSKAVAQSVTEMSKLGSDSPPKSQPSKPFDINDYRLTADSLSGAALQLRQLSTDLQGLIDSPELQSRLDDMDARIDRLSGQASAQARLVADHAAWRGVQLLFLAFGLAIVYRIIASRWIKQRA